MTTSAERRQALVGAALLLAVAGAGNLLFLGFPRVFIPLREQATDSLFRARSASERFRPPIDPVVAHVPIDDASLEQTGKIYFGREDHADLVRTLGRLEVAAQVHDVIFAAPQDETVDARLERAIRRADNAYFGMALDAGPGPPAAAEPDQTAVLDGGRWHPHVTGDPSGLLAARGYSLTWPRFALASRGLGFLDITDDVDGVYRRAPLLVRDGAGFQPSLPLRVVCDWLGVAPETIEVRPGRSIRLPGARRPGAEAPRTIEIPIDEAGRMIVNYVGPWGSIPAHPYSIVWEASGDRFFLDDLREVMQGKIVVVSWVATGAGDIGTVPTETEYPLPGIHANTINTILTEQFLRRPSLSLTLLLVELPLLGLLLGATLRLRTIGFVAAAALLGLTYYAVAWFAFMRFGLLLDIPGPMILLGAGTVVSAAWRYHVEARNRAVLRSTFDAYFSPAVVDQAMTHADALVGAAEKKELTILFSDIKSFTSHTSEMDAAHVRKLLNEYFEEMIEIVFEHGGTLDKFIGDGLMVFFGDPEPQPDHAARCVRAAVAMQRAAREMNARWTARGDMPLLIRVGINTGEVVVGNMGSARRLSYTVLGEAVNLAQRLESNAPVGGVLISRRTAELLDGTIAVEPIEPIRVKGIDRPIEVCVVPVDP